MKSLYFSLPFISLTVTADPFFGEQNTLYQPEKAETSVEFAKNLENLTACNIAEHKTKLNLATDFEKLKLVGLVRISDQFRALFIDDNNQLLDLKEGEYLSHQQIEIKTINLKALTYINWKLTQDCNSPYEVTIKL